MIEFCHNVEEYLQPSPSRNPGGDCFACCLTAILKHFYPKERVDFNRTWEYFLKCYLGETEKRALSNTWPGMYDAIIEAIRDEKHNFKLEYRREYVYPKLDIEHHSGNWGLEQYEGECGYYLEAWLRAGWIAIIQIEYNPSGRYGRRPDGFRQSHDHFAIIDGIKMGWRYKKHNTDGKEWESGSLTADVHIVCSAKGKYWIDYKELLEAHGVGAWILVRKDVIERL